MAAPTTPAHPEERAQLLREHQAGRQHEEAGADRQESYGRERVGGAASLAPGAEDQVERLLHGLSRPQPLEDKNGECKVRDETPGAANQLMQSAAQAGVLGAFVDPIKNHPNHVLFMVSRCVALE